MTVKELIVDQIVDDVAKQDTSQRTVAEATVFRITLERSLRRLRRENNDKVVTDTHRCL